jgi:hypothetical protein
MEFKLSTNVRVKKGSTRDTTAENNAAIMKQFYLEVFQPLYMATNRLDLAANYSKMMGQMAGIPHIDELVPTAEDTKMTMQKNAEVEQIQKAQAMNEINATSAPTGNQNAAIPL